MKIELTDHDDVTVFRLVGHLDSNSTPEFETYLFRVIDEGSRRILVDLIDVDFIGSVALRTFLLAARKVVAAGGGMGLCGPNEAVRETLDASGFSKLMQVFDSREEALARL
jgi:anti-sigma B factor antagonist